MLVTQITCSVCGQKKDVEHSAHEVAPLICGDCIQKSKALMKQRVLDHLKNLSIEKRLERVEEMLYDNPPHQPYNNIMDKRFA
jgi:hypothetical protein